VCFVVESGTDARMVEGLAARVDLRVLARAIPGGRAISRPTAVPVAIGPAGRAAFAFQVFVTLLRTPVDAILVQGYGLAALAANLAARMRRVRCWMLVCSPVAEYYETRRMAAASFSPWTLRGLHLLGRVNGLVGAGYVVLGDYLASVVRRYAPSKPVHGIPVYGVDLSRFGEWPDRAAVRRQRGLPVRGQIIFSSSRVAPEKDTGTLLQAFALLVADGRDVYLLNRSGGFREFMELAVRAGVQDRVIATEAVDPRAELPLDYAACDVCVQASRAEGLGFSVLEAMASYRPVVASAVGGLLETVKNGVTGWTVPPSDPVALAAALREALDDAGAARKRAEAGARLVRERFETGDAFDRLAALLSGSAR
jgi:glycosyltransferase involved in cell wall biosynthesis